MLRNGWSSNKDFFREQKVQNLFPHIMDMVVQLPHKVNYKYTYISDAGYGWKKIVNIENNDINNYGDVDIKNYKELKNIIFTSKNLILSTHPHRWESNWIRYINNFYIFKILRFLVRFLSNVPILKNIISKYYYLAKKI